MFALLLERARPRPLPINMDLTNAHPGVGAIAFFFLLPCGARLCGSAVFFLWRLQGGAHKIPKVLTKGAFWEAVDMDQMY